MAAQGAGGGGPSSFPCALPLPLLPQELGEAAGPSSREALGAGLPTEAVSDQWDMEAHRGQHLPANPGASSGVGSVELDGHLCEWVWTLLLRAQPMLRLGLSLGWAGGKGKVGPQPLGFGVRQPELHAQLYYLLWAGALPQGLSPSSSWSRFLPSIQVPQNASPPQEAFLDHSG